MPRPYTFGNMGRLHPQLRGDRVENVDFSVFKNFSIRERSQLQLRAEAFKAPNRVIFGDPNTTVGDINFGRVTSQANAPRQIQLALKLIF